MSLRLAAALALLAALGQRAVAHPPAAEPAQLFADDVPGPEGIAFTRDGDLVVGTAVGDVLRFDRDATFTTLASLGEPLAGITVLRDGRVLAASFGPGRVWSVDPDTGAATIFASGIPGANFVVQSRAGRILASASSAGTIVDITDGVPIVRASGLSFPNGLAIGRDGFLYVAELTASRISRLFLSDDGTLGGVETYATGASLADGIAFDRADNLLIAGGGGISVVVAGTNMAVPLVASDPLFNLPSNLAFGRCRGFRRRDVYAVNFGLPLGSGTTIIRLPYNHRGARLIR